MKGASLSKWSIEGPLGGVEVIAAGITVKIDLGTGSYQCNDGSKFESIMPSGQRGFSFRLRRHSITTFPPKSVTVSMLLGLVSVAVAKECARNQLLKKAVQEAICPVVCKAESAIPPPDPDHAPDHSIGPEETARLYFSWTRLPPVLECDGDIMEGITVQHIKDEWENLLSGHSSKLVSFRTIATNHYQLVWSCDDDGCWRRRRLDDLTT